MDIDTAFIIELMMFWVIFGAVCFCCLASRQKGRNKKRLLAIACGICTIIVIALTAVSYGISDTAY